MTNDNNNDSSLFPSECCVKSHCGFATLLQLLLLLLLYNIAVILTDEFVC